ncbi:unnamed protein product [Gadus morhua 'NCC']
MRAGDHRGHRHTPLPVPGTERPAAGGRDPGRHSPSYWNGCVCFPAPLCDTRGLRTALLTPPPPRCARRAVHTARLIRPAVQAPPAARCTRRPAGRGRFLTVWGAVPHRRKTLDMSSVFQSLAWL